MMDIRDYQKAAMRTSTDGHDRKLNGCMGLIGESGEVVDVVKKWKFQSGDHAAIPKDKLIDELGDVLWYLAEISTGYGMDMIEQMELLGFDLNDTLFYDENLLEIDAINLGLSAARLAAMIQGEEPPVRVMYDVSQMIDLISHILKDFCGSTLSMCMQKNIEKLLRRYPEGFDPERSLHRKE